MNVSSLHLSILAGARFGAVGPAASAAAPSVAGPRTHLRPRRRTRQRLAGVLLGLVVTTPAIAIGPSYTSYYVASRCAPFSEVSSPDVSVVCGPNFVQGTGSFDGGRVSAGLSAGLYRYGWDGGTLFTSSIDAQYNWNDQLSIVSATLPAGTPVLLTLGTQLSLRYDVSERDPAHADDGVYAGAHLKVASPTLFANDVARTRFRSTAGWQYADETSGSAGVYSSGGTTGITRQSVVVRVGEVVNLDLIFRATAGMSGAFWWEVDTPYEANLRNVDAFFAVSVAPLTSAASSRPHDTFGALSAPLVDYVSASGVRYPSALPVPEPGTLAMLLGGLAFVGGLRRRLQGERS